MVVVKAVDYFSFPMADGLCDVRQFFDVIDKRLNDKIIEPTGNAVDSAGPVPVRVLLFHVVNYTKFNVEREHFVYKYIY